MQKGEKGNSLSESRVRSGGMDLEAFEPWLRERRLAPEHRMRFLVGWVQRFLRLQATRPKEDWQDTLRAFLEDLSEGQTKSWQLRQAADAVTLYCGQFCGADETRVLPIRHTGVEQPDFDQVLAETRQLMELRHYSPRTMRTYLGWTRRFLRYARRSGSAELQPEAVKAYLSYLATRRNVAASAFRVADPECAVCRRICST